MSSDWLAPFVKPRTASRIDCCSASTGVSCLAGKSLAQAGDLKKLVVGVLRFGDAVAEKNQGVFGLELHARRSEFGFGNQAHGERSLRVEFAHLALAQQQRRGMAGFDVFEHAVAAHDADEHGGVAADFGVAAEETVDRG